MNSKETITLELLVKDLASGKLGAFIGHIDTASRRGGIMGSVFQGVGQSVGRSITSMINPTMLLTGVIDQAGDAAVKLLSGVFTEAIQGEVVTARLTQSLKNNIDAWDGNMAAIDAASKAAEQYGFVNDDVENSVASAVIATKNLGDAITIVTVAQDLARAKNMSLEDATKVLTKAFNGSTTSLTRMGIKIDSTHKGLDTVRDVEKAVGDQSKTMSKTFAGRLGTMGASLSNFQEEIGTKLMPQLEGWAADAFGIIQNVTHAFDAFNGGNRAWGTVQKPFTGKQGTTTGDGGKWSRHHASGGMIRDWGYVGENGMEKVTLTPWGAKVTPMGGGSGGSGIHVHLHTMTTPNPVDAERFARQFGPAIKSELQRLG